MFYKFFLRIKSSPELSPLITAITTTTATTSILTRIYKEQNDYWYFLDPLGYVPNY